MAIILHSPKGIERSGPTSKVDYGSAVQAAGVEGQIAAAQFQVGSDKLTLGYKKIYAPMSGTIASVSIKQGQTIRSVQQAPTRHALYRDVRRRESCQ